MSEEQNCQCVRISCQPKEFAPRIQPTAPPAFPMPSMSRRGEFNAGEWTFPDSPLHGLYQHDAVYKNIRDWASFEPWLSRIEKMSADVMWTIGKMIPEEWYGATEDLEALVEELLQRRSRVRDLITCCRRSRRSPFPLWTEDGAI